MKSSKLQEIVTALAKLPVKDATSKIIANANRMNEHIVKLIFWGNQRDGDHWYKEIVNRFIKDIYNVRIDFPSRKKFKQDKYKDLISHLDNDKGFWGDYAICNDLIKTYPQQFTHLEVKYKWKKIEPCFKKFYKNLAAYLTTDQEYNPNKVESLLNDLLLEIKSCIMQG